MIIFKKWRNSAKPIQSVKAEVYAKQKIDVFMALKAYQEDFLHKGNNFL
jgi:hypothetical protein